jgi:hypothetical protein
MGTDSYILLLNDVFSWSLLKKVLFIVRFCWVFFSFPFFVDLYFFPEIYLLQAHHYSGPGLFCVTNEMRR